ncbi:hypothetical protein EJ07DRAFT_150268 [Lizonia empirigonia]|nr:hypothetical protein EJ07DRAFT_150268 [Lizonia empirigonia]
MCSGGARKGSPLEAAGCTGKAAKLRVGQAEVQMHALADAARCKQEEDASTLKQRRGRVVYNTNGEKPVKRPYVEKLHDAFSDSGLPRLDHSQGDLEGFTTRLAQHGQGSVLTSGSVQLQCRRRQAANNMSLEGNSMTTRRATGQPKGSIATSRPWRAVDKRPSPLDPLGSPLARAASDAALARPPMSATLRLGRTAATPRSGIVGINDTFLLHQASVARDTTFKRKVLAEGCRDGFPAFHSGGFLQNVLRAPPLAEALADCQIRGLPLGAKSLVLLEPDGRRLHDNDTAHSIATLVKLSLHRPCIVSNLERATESGHCSVDPGPRSPRSSSLTSTSGRADGCKIEAYLLRYLQSAPDRP